MKERKEEASSSNNDEVFSIVATSSIHHIVEGVPVKGFVKENSINYYIFDVNRQVA